MIKKILLTLVLVGCTNKPPAPSHQEPVVKVPPAGVTFMCSSGLTRCLDLAKTVCSTKVGTNEVFIMGQVVYTGSKDYLIMCDAPNTVFYYHGQQTKQDE